MTTVLIIVAFNAWVALNMFNSWMNLKMDEKLYKNYQVSYKIDVERKMKDGGYSRFCDQDLKEVILEDLYDHSRKQSQKSS